MVIAGSQYHSNQADSLYSKLRTNHRRLNNVANDWPIHYNHRPRIDRKSQTQAHNVVVVQRDAGMFHACMVPSIADE